MCFLICVSVSVSSPHVPQCLCWLCIAGPGAEGVSWYPSLRLIACHCHIMRGATDPPKFLPNILHPKLCYILTNGRSEDFHKFGIVFDFYWSKTGVIIWGPGHGHWKKSLFLCNLDFWKCAFNSQKEKVNMSTRVHSEVLLGLSCIFGGNLLFAQPDLC